MGTISLSDSESGCLWLREHPQSHRADDTSTSLIASIYVGDQGMRRREETRHERAWGIVGKIGGDAEARILGSSTRKEHSTQYVLPQALYTFIMQRASIVRPSLYRVNS